MYEEGQFSVVPFAAAIKTKSILASNGGTFYIQVRINGNVEASWSQYVSSVSYQPYYHSAGVSLAVNAEE